MTPNIQKAKNLTQLAMRVEKCLDVGIKAFLGSTKGLPYVSVLQNTIKLAPPLSNIMAPNVQKAKNLTQPTMSVEMFLETAAKV
jgi:hypothetical protein